MDIYNTNAKKNYERFRMFLLSNLIGVGMLGYLLMVRVYSEIMYAIYTAVSYETYERLINSSIFNNLTYIVYAGLCVVLPFSIVYLISKRIFSYKIPYGKIKPDSGFVPTILIGWGICVLGNYVSGIFSMITERFFESTPTGAPSDVTSAAQITFVGFLVSVISTAVVPALVEEFALRGVVMQPLRRFGDKFAVVISAVVFALIHGNFEQIPFAFVVGLALGYVVIRTGSIWTGVVLHFINNFWAVCTEYMYYLMPAEWYFIIYYGTNAIVCVAAIAAAVYLYKKDVRNGITEGVLEKPNCSISIFQKSLFAIYSPAFLLGAWLFLDTALQNFEKV